MSIKRAGVITGNPMNGLYYRECIEVTKVLDGCIIKQNDIVFEINIPSVDAPYPFSFISGRSNGNPTMSNLIIMPYNQKKVRLSFDLLIPLNITFSDASGIQHTVNSNAALHREVVLSMPPDSLTPFDVSADASIIIEQAIFNSPTSLTIYCCIAQVTKLTAKVDILVPSYGYCQYPDCREREADLASPCDALNLFPPRQ